MSPADITALRDTACRVFAELGQGLAALEDAEGLLNPNGLATLEASYVHGQHAAASCTALGHERMQTACAALESAAAHLAELVAAADNLATSIAPQGVAP